MQASFTDSGISFRVNDDDLCESSLSLSGSSTRLSDPRYPDKHFINMPGRCCTDPLIKQVENNANPKV
jgi:hypothetical protein